MRHPIEEIRCDRCGRRVSEEKLKEHKMAAGAMHEGRQFYACGTILHPYKETCSRCTGVLEAAARRVAPPQKQESDDD